MENKFELLLVGGVDSFGVPYTRDNKQRKSHLTILRDSLQQLGKNVKMIDMYCMSNYNTTEYISQLLNSSLRLSDIRKNQRESINLCRKMGIFQFIQLNKNMIEYYTDESKDEVLSELIKNNKTIFIYSCGVNDFLYNSNMDLGKMLSSYNMKKAFSKIEESITMVIVKIRKNIEEIINLNFRCEIYVLGIFTPTKWKYIRNRVSEPIAIFNKALSNLCAEYENVHFIDNSNLTIDHMASIDWHPNLRGQEQIGENIFSNIKKNSKII